MSRPRIRQVRNSMFTQTRCFATGKESAGFICVDGARTIRRVSSRLLPYRAELVKWNLRNSHQDTLDENSLTPGLRLERLKLDKEGFIELAVQREVDARLGTEKGVAAVPTQKIGVTLRV